MHDKFIFHWTAIKVPLDLHGLILHRHITLDKEVTLRMGQIRNLTQIKLNILNISNMNQVFSGFEFD